MRQRRGGPLPRPRCFHGSLTPGSLRAILTPDQRRSATVQIPPEMYQINEKGCRIWLGPVNKTTKRPAMPGTVTPLFRFLCWLRNGNPPSWDYHAAHTCNEPMCVNEEHSEWQTPEQNNPTTHQFDRQITKYVEQGVNVTLKRRRSNKGNNRNFIGWCTTFRYNTVYYKSGAYYHEDGAKKWAAGKLSELSAAT